MSRVIAILALLLCVAHAQARTLYVSLTGSHDTNAPAFSTWATAATNIQAAIDAASDGDTVRVAPGTYVGSTAADEGTAVVFVTNEVHLVAGNGTLWDAERTIIDAQFVSLRSCVAFGKATNASIRGFTLTRGNHYGGAIRAAILGAYGVSPGVVIDSCIVRGNITSAYFGPIVHLPGIGSSIKNSIIVGNQPSQGFAAIYGNYAPSYVENCIVEANWFGQINIENVQNTIYGNTIDAITSLGGNITNNTTNSVCQLYNICPASKGVGSNLVWAGVAAYIPRLGSLARKNGAAYIGIETASDGAGGPALVTSRPFLGRDATTNLNHGAIFGGVTASTNSPFPQSRSAAFDGASGAVYMYPPIPNLANDFTVELWAYRDKQASQYIFYQGDSSAGGPLIGIADPNNGAFQFVVRSADSTLINLNAGTFRTTNWVHLALVWRAGEKSVRGYVNGVQVGGVTNASVNDTTYSIASFGNFRRLNNNWFDGNISDVRIWNVARTPEQIAAAYTNRLTGTEEGLVGYWPLTGTTSPIDTGPFNLDNPIIHPSYHEAF